MSEERIVPKFASEREEAQWWFDNREKHAQQFVEAAAAGQTRRNTLANRLAAARAMMTLDLDREDIVKARELAEQRGLEVNVLLTQIVHEALEREAQSAA